jgi:MFS family permease
VNLKTVIWLYIFIFIAFFDLHAQFPMLTPYAISLGAVPSFIGLIMGLTSLTHLPGNWLAGVSVDKYGSKPFIVSSLLLAGGLLMIQGIVHNPWQLLAVRSISGFVLAFLSPACLALLAKMAKNPIHQSKLMAGNGLVHTLASVIAPAAGAWLVSEIGFTAAFSALGWGLIGAAIFAIFSVQESRQLPSPASAEPLLPAQTTHSATLPWLFYGIPLALSCSQGILFFEIPLMMSSQTSLMHSGMLFSIISFGALLTLSMIFLNHISPYARSIAGSLCLALIFYGMAMDWSVPIGITLLLIGMSKGVIYPAIAAMLATLTNEQKYGRVFSLLSIAYSIGAFIGPMSAGQLREMISPYYIAFIILMLAIALLPPPIRLQSSAIHHLQ